MSMGPQHQQSIDDAIKARFRELPKVVQDAVTSATVEKHLRGLADLHKLHLDQWETLENQVMLTLMGFQRAEDLEKNILESVRIAPDIAHLLAVDIAQNVFEPIRKELERGLDHPQAEVKKVSDVEAMRQTVLGQKLPEPISIGTPDTVPGQDGPPHEEAPTTAPAPSIPPVGEAPDEKKVVRAPLSESYKPAAPSTARGAIEGDPYREQVD